MGFESKGRERSAAGAEYSIGGFLLFGVGWPEYLFYVPVYNIVGPFLDHVDPVTQKYS